MKIELLPFERWPELQRAFDESRSDEHLPKPEQSIMLAAFDGDRIVGCVGAQRVWNVSPFWVERSYRGSGLAEALVHDLATYNTEGLRETCVTTSSHVEKLIFGLNFIPIEGQLWRRDVK